MEMTIVIAVTALATSVLTLALGALAWRAWGQPRFDAELLKIQDEFEKRVRAGVLAAGQELLPAFRQQVSAGFAAVLKESHAAGIAEGTAKIVTGSTELLVDRLSDLFGLKKK